MTKKERENVGGIDLCGCKSGWCFEVCCLNNMELCMFAERLIYGTVRAERSMMAIIFEPAFGCHAEEVPSLSPINRGLVVRGN